jgi:hypothetical protein
MAFSLATDKFTVYGIFKGQVLAILVGVIPSLTSDYTIKNCFAFDLDRKAWKLINNPRLLDRFRR